MHELKETVIYIDEAEVKMCFVLFQTSISVKAFFPQSPSSLLVPLLTMPSGQCADTHVVCVIVCFWMFHSDTMHKTHHCEEDCD